MNTPTRRAATLTLLLLCTLPVAGSAGPLAAAIEHFEARRFQQARRLLAPYVTAHPRDAEAAYYLGRTYLEEGGHFDEAIEWLEKATRLAPQRGEFIFWLARAYGRAAQEANMLRKPSLAGKAHDAWRTAVKLDPTNLDARADLITFYLAAPGFMGGSVEKAREQAAEIAKRDPVRGALARANIALDQKDTAGAERTLREALAKSPAEPRLRQALGFFYQSQKRWDAAFEVFEAMVTADADAWNALYQLGRTAALSGKRLERGAETLRRYLGHQPEGDEPPLANAHYRLGMIFQQQGSKEAARREYQAALRLDPELDDAKQALAKLG